MIYEKHVQEKWNLIEEYKEILTFEYFELGKYLLPYVFYPQH